MAVASLEPFDSLSVLVLGAIMMMQVVPYDVECDGCPTWIGKRIIYSWKSAVLADQSLIAKLHYHPRPEQTLSAKV